MDILCMGCYTREQVNIAPLDMNGYCALLGRVEELRDITNDKQKKRYPLGVEVYEYSKGMGIFDPIPVIQQR